MLKASVKYGVAKLYVCLSSCLTLYQLWQVPSGYGAQLIMLLMGVAVGAGLVDAVVNDLMPYQYFSRRAQKYRYVIFIALAGTQMPLLYNDVIAHEVDFDTFRYAIDASVAVLVAILGLWSRHRWVAQNHAANLVESPVP